MKRIGIILLIFIGIVPALAQDNGISTYDGTMRRIRVPILMYHYVSPLPPDADVFRVDLTVEPEIFRQHINYLRDAGYETISLYDLDQALRYGTPLPPRPVILTFDDGHVDHYDYVYPTLKEVGYTATFFVITGKSDHNEVAHLDWEQVREMAHGGMDMQSHSKSHRSMSGRDRDYLIYEIVGSVESLEAHTAQPVHMFCYPAGQYDGHTLEVLRQLPILRAVTTQPGTLHTTDNNLEVPRLRVTGNLHVGGLKQLLESVQ